MSKQFAFSENQVSYIFGGISCICLILSLTGIFKELLLLPFVLLFVLWSVADYTFIYKFFFLLLPFSIEVYLPNGLGTDLPSEPYMLYLTFLCFFLLLWRGKEIDKRIFTHPISLLIALHILWIGITAFMSTFKVVSFKFLLAKIWYVFPFYIMPLLLIKEVKDIKSIIKFLLLGTFLSMVYVVLRHALLGFDFKDINQACKPIYRNHVSYAGILVLTLPYVWALRQQVTTKWIFTGGILFWLFAIYLTYTRAAHGIVFLSIAMYWVIRLRAVPLAALCSIVGVVLLSIFYMHNDRYLELAPNYEKTISHKNFDNLIEATYKMEDISTMERLHRWVAGFHMATEKPLFGFGPGTFYFNYKKHTINSFQTYVSRNPEKSGIHSYYLMMLVDQGIIGCLLFLTLLLTPLFYAQELYHKLKTKSSKLWLMATTLSLFSIAVLILINDMIETDKIGSLFFLALAFIVFFDLKKKDFVR